MNDRGIYDPLSRTAEEAYRAIANHSGDGQTPDQPKKFLQFYSPTELRNYQEPEGHNLVGDYHIQRGAIAVLAGAPGVCKSHATLWLALEGAIGEGSWFGLPVHCQFRTLILQNENGLVRLHHDFKQMKLPDQVDSWIRVSSPPPFGMLMDNQEFRAELRAIIDDFAPHLLIIDPWNSVTRDVMEKDYQQAFIWIREILANRLENPACLIIHHLRKPRLGEHQRERGLINLMAGSYTIFSVPRSAMVLQRASDSLENNQIVFNPLKNNDGVELGKRSAWELCDGGFLEVPDFDWSNFDARGAENKRGPKVTEEHVRMTFNDGKAWIELTQAVEKLKEIADVKDTTAYEALKIYGGRFSHILRRRDDGKIGLRESELL